MSGTVFNCTPLPNTGCMEAELLWWHDWALVKVKVHSPSWPAISASWTVHPGTKFLCLVYSYPVLKKLLSYPRACKPSSSEQQSSKWRMNAISLYQPPFISPHWSIVTASLSKAKRCLPTWHGLFLWLLGHLPVSWWLVYLVVPSEGKSIRLWSAVPCGRKRRHWSVQTNYQLEGALRRFFSFTCKQSKRYGGLSWLLRLSLWFNSIHSAYRKHSAQGQITYMASAIWEWCR